MRYKILHFLLFVALFWSFGAFSFNPDQFSATFFEKAERADIADTLLSFEKYLSTALQEDSKTDVMLQTQKYLPGWLSEINKRKDELVKYYPYYGSENVFSYDLHVGRLIEVSEQLTEPINTGLADKLVKILSDNKVQGRLESDFYFDKNAASFLKLNHHLVEIKQAFNRGDDFHYLTDLLNWYCTTVESIISKQQNLRNSLDSMRLSYLLQRNFVEIVGSEAYLILDRYKADPFLNQETRANDLKVLSGAINSLELIRRIHIPKKKTGNKGLVLFEDIEPEPKNPLQLKREKYMIQGTFSDSYPSPISVEKAQEIAKMLTEVRQLADNGHFKEIIKEHNWTMHHLSAEFPESFVETMAEFYAFHSKDFINFINSVLERQDLWLMTGPYNYCVYSITKENHFKLFLIFDDPITKRLGFTASGYVGNPLYNYIQGLYPETDLSYMATSSVKAELRK